MRTKLLHPTSNLLGFFRASLSYSMVNGESVHPQVWDQFLRNELSAKIRQGDGVAASADRKTCKY